MRNSTTTPLLHSRPLSILLPSTRSTSALLDSRELRRRQKAARYFGIDGSVLLAVGAGLDPFRVVEELVPLGFAVGEGFPGEHVGEVVGVGAY